MQYFKYQHIDDTDDYQPCISIGVDCVAQYNSSCNDYNIMVARVKASNRGATPNEIQSNVEMLKSS